MKTEEVIARLQEKLGSSVRCPMCGGTHFHLAEGYFINSVQKEMNSFQFGGESIPTIAVICGKCGFMSQHAIGILDPELVRAEKAGAKQ